jgi:H+/Cl- antiporter ClcA
VWYLFTITTNGVWVPSGLFLPGILIGCSVGIMYLQLMMGAFDLNIYEISGQSYIIMGASAMLASYCRLSYSLAVIMLETTQSINLFLPIVFTIMVSLATARACNRSLYDYSLRSKQVPLLRNHLPKENKDIRVRDMNCVNLL